MGFGVSFTPKTRSKMHSREMVFCVKRIGKLQKIRQPAAGKRTVDDPCAQETFGSPPQEIELALLANHFASLINLLC